MPNFGPQTSGYQLQVKTIDTVTAPAGFRQAGYGFAAPPGNGIDPNGELHFYQTIGTPYAPPRENGAALWGNSVAQTWPSWKNALPASANAKYWRGVAAPTYNADPTETFTNLSTRLAGLQLPGSFPAAGGPSQIYQGLVEILDSNRTRVGCVLVVDLGGGTFGEIWTLQNAHAILDRDGANPKPVYMLRAMYGWPTDANAWDSAYFSRAVTWLHSDLGVTSATYKRHILKFRAYPSIPVLP